MEADDTISLQPFPGDDELNEFCQMDEIVGRKEFLNISDDFYSKYSKVYKEYFEGWFTEVNGHFIAEAEKFVRKVIEDDSPFRSLSDRIIHMMTFFLRIEFNDHISIVKLIEDHLDDTFPKLDITRIGIKVTKRSELTNIIGELDTNKHNLIIVDQAECLIESSLHRSLIDDLQILLESNSKKRVLLMVCCSRFADFDRELPEESKKKWIRYEDVYGRGVTHTSDLLRTKLLKHDMIFQLGPKVVDYIIDRFAMKKLSLSDLLYAYDICVYEHLTRPEALLHLSEKELVSALQVSPYLVESIMNLKSLEGLETGIDWSDVKSVARFCTKKLRDLREYHKYLMTQLECYFCLMRDPTGEYFPESLNGIYSELLDHTDLGDSPAFVDAIKRLKSISSETAIKRINAILSSVGSSCRSKSDVRFILHGHLRKMENNYSVKLDNEFIRALLDQSGTLKSPFRLPLQEAYYYDNYFKLQERTSFAFRKKIDQDTGLGDPFSILYELIKASPEMINSKDLFEEFKMKLSEKSDEPIEPQGETEEDQHTSSPPGRRLRRSTMSARSAKKIRSTINEQKSRTPDLDEKTLKVLFVDLIETLELHGILKTDQRRSRKGMLIRCVWP